MVQIPLNGLLDSVLEHGLRKPSELMVDLRRINGISLIMALPIRDMLNQGVGLAEIIQNQLHDVDVVHLVVSANVVDLTNRPLAQNEVDRLAVVLDVKPVTYIQSLSVNRKFLVCECICNHQGNQLLRELIGAVVVRAAADRYRKPVCSVVRVYQQIRGSLRCAVRA